MKIEIIRDDIRVAEHITDDPQIVVKNNKRFWKCGAILEVPPRAVQLLVGNGDAKPHCKASQKMCSDYEAKLADRKLARDMLAAGIEPEDRERFRNGEILGYDADGNDIPGPNWKEDEEETE